MFDQTIHNLKTMYGQIDKLIEKFDTQNQLDLISYLQKKLLRMLKEWEACVRDLNTVCMGVRMFNLQN